MSSEIAGSASSVDKSEPPTEKIVGSKRKTTPEEESRKSQESQMWLQYAEAKEKVCDAREEAWRLQEEIWRVHELFTIAQSVLKNAEVECQAANKAWRKTTTNRFSRTHY